MRFTGGAIVVSEAFGIWWLFGSSAVVFALMLVQRHINRGYRILIAFVWIVFATVTFAMAR